MMDAYDEDTSEGLSTGQIVANSVEFLLAGYETTSSALTFTSYLLATHTEVQERLANEIHEYLEENPVSSDKLSMFMLTNIINSYHLWLDVGHFAQSLISDH